MGTAPSRLRPRGRGARRAALLALIVVALAWAAAYAWRLALGMSNIDDYMYAGMAEDFWGAALAGPRELVGQWRAYAANSPLLPTLAAPFTILSASPHALTAIQLPLLLAFAAASAWLLRGLGIAWPRAWTGAVVVSILSAVLWYAAMLHFGVLAALGTVAALAAYLASDRLASRRLALVFGAALGLLLLSRVTAVVYVAAIAVPVGIHLLAGRPPQLGRRMANLGLAAAVCLVIAGPWWLVNGGSTLAYLVGYGLDDHSAWTSEATPVEKVVLRVARTIEETGLIAFALLSAMSLALLAQRWRRRRGGAEDGERWASAAVVVAAGLLGLAFLSTSSNLGTAFALPCVALLGVASAAWLAEPRPRSAGADAGADADAGSSASNPARRRPLALAGGLALALASLVVLLPIGAPPRLGSLPLVVTGPPSAEQSYRALGCRCAADQERISREVAEASAGVPVAVMRADAVLNGSSLDAAADEAGIDLRQLSWSPVDLVGDRELLGAFDVVVSGETLASYRPAIDAAAIAGILREEGFELVYEHRFSPSNSVEVWRRAGS